MSEATQDQPSGVVDLRYTDADTANFIGSYFAAKSRHDPEAFLAFYSPDAITHADVPLGRPMNGLDAIKATFTMAMPHMGDGRSYATEIFGAFGGDDGSAVVAFVNTPGMIGPELVYLIAAVDVRGAKLVRWVDYWDSSVMAPETRTMFRAPDDGFPTTFSEEQLSPLGHGAVGSVATSLQYALADGDGAKVAALFDEDGVWEDRALGVRMAGRLAIENYLTRAGELAPYGPGSRLRNILGRDSAGGFEWAAGSAAAPTVLNGITALTVTAAGNIGKAIAVYDAKLLSDDSRAKLVTLATSPR